MKRLLSKREGALAIKKIGEVLCQDLELLFAGVKGRR